MRTSSPVVCDDLERIVRLVREDARRRESDVAARSFETFDGRVIVEYRAGGYVRVSFLGDGPLRSHMLAPDWPSRARGGIGRPLPGEV